MAGCDGVGDVPALWGVPRLPVGLGVAVPPLLPSDGPGPEEAEVCELPPPEVLQAQNTLKVSHSNCIGINLQHNIALHMKKNGSVLTIKAGPLTFVRF